MPPHPRYVLRSGTTRVRMLFFAGALEGTGRAGRTGLSHDTTGARAAYVREGQSARTIELAPGEGGRWVPGSFIEVDPEVVPGVYELHVPDEALAEGSCHAVFVLRFPGAVIDPIEVALVRYDPRDPRGLGLVSLDPVLHGHYLRKGMPGLARMELALWEESDRASGTPDGS